MTKVLLTMLSFLIGSSLYASEIRCDFFSGLSSSASNKLDTWISSRGVSGALFLPRSLEGHFVSVGFKNPFQRDVFQISLWKDGPKGQLNTLVEFAEAKVLLDQLDLSTFLRTANTLVHCYSTR